MNNQIKSYEDLLQRVWTDENFKNRFITNPKAILAEIGVKIPDSVKVEVHEESLNLKHFVLPLKSKFQGDNIAAPDPAFAAVMQRAWDDESFKAHLLQNPKAAIKEVTGKEMSDTLTIYIHEDTPILKHLVVPINIATEELNDLELMMVAGGSIAPKNPGGFFAQ
jgi:hypothetical protein